MSNRDWLLLIFLALVFGAAFFFIEIALRDIGVLLVVWSRVTLAGLVLTTWVIARGEHIPPLNWDGWKIWGILLLMGLFNNSLPFFLITTAQLQLSGGLASVFVTTAPIFSLILGHIFTHDEKITLPKFIGILIGTFGVAVLFGPGVLSQFDLTSLAQLSAMGGAVCYAIGGIIGKRLAHLSSATAAGLSLLCASVWLLPLVMIYDSPFEADWTQSALGAVLGIALVSTVIAYLLYFTLLRSAGATNMLLVTLLAPVSAIGLGALFLGETVSLQMLGGMGVIFIGLAAIDGRLLKPLRGRGKAEA